MCASWIVCQTASSAHALSVKIVLSRTYFCAPSLGFPRCIGHSQHAPPLNLPHVCMYVQCLTPYPAHHSQARLHDRTVRHDGAARVDCSVYTHHMHRIITCISSCTIPFLHAVAGTMGTTGKEGQRRGTKNAATVGQIAFTTCECMADKQRALSSDKCRSSHHSLLSPSQPL